MYEPISNLWHFKSAGVWIDFVISLIVIAGLTFVMINASKRKIFTITSIATASVCVLAWFFGLQFLWTLSIVLLVALTTAAIILNQNEFTRGR